MIELSDIQKSYGSGRQRLPVLRGIDLHVASGEFVAIMGPSGSGKSTLLNVLGVLDGYDEGEYRLAGRRIVGLDETGAAKVRNELIGFVFQAFNLLPFLNAWENVALPLLYRGTPPAERERRARELLARVGLEHRAEHRPAELSGGQCQRVAIARALVTSPQVIFADEPTGALDTQTSDEIMDLLGELHREGATLVMVTHEDAVAASAQRLIRLRDGVVVS